MADFEGLAPVTRTTTAGLIADRIRTGIMNGVFPPGAQLGEAQLATSLAVSRGPVREALQRLVQEGLLFSEPHRGVFVRSLSDEDVTDIYFARTAVEQAAVRRVLDGEVAAIRCELEDLVARMDKAASAGQLDAVMDLDLELHQRVVTGAGSRRLTRLFSTLLVETRMCRAGLDRTYPTVEELVADHRRLVEALRDGSRRRALAAIAAHLDDAARRLRSPA